MSGLATGAVALALALDLAVEEFPRQVHPVGIFGRVVEWFDREWGRPRAVGVAVAATLPVAAAAVAGGTTALIAVRWPVAGAVLAGLWLFSTTSLRMLLSAARRVIDAAERDPGRAREAARALVGRDTAGFDPPQFYSAAVESVAENLADGLVAPLLAFASLAWLSLPAAVGAAAWVKAVNTLDSMLGYRHKPVGWASARLDDAVVWVPARATAALIAVAGGSPTAILGARQWARLPASPNSGWPMATMAAVLSVRLEKPGAYAVGPGTTLPEADRARRALRVGAGAGGLAVVLTGVVAWF